MNSSTPQEPWPQEPDLSVDDIHSPEPDEADTGPLQEVLPDEPADAQRVTPRGDLQPAQPALTHFDAPLTVNPRPARRRRDPKPLIIGTAAIGVVVAVGGLIFWLTRPSEDSAQPPSAEEPTTISEDGTRLMQQLPKGYRTDACESVPALEHVLAQVDCDRNSDPGGPLWATYSLVGDKASLELVFNDAIAAATRVNCPGNIQSPGPWRRNATPDKISGNLFCGLQEGQPTVVWTDEAKMTVSAVRGGPAGPTFPQLYAWWSSHS